MTAATVTLIQEHHQPYTMKSGTAEKRLTKVYIEATSAGTGDTLDLGTYLSGLTAILCIEGSTLDGADATNQTENTFATTILTFAGHAGSGVWNITLIAHY